MTTAPAGSRGTASSDAVARVNRTTIVELLRAAGMLSRQQIVDRTGLSPATVNRLTAALLAENVIAVAGRSPSNGGRPSVLLRYAGEGRLVASVQVQAHQVQGALVDLDGRVVLRRTTAMGTPPPEGDPTAETWQLAAVTEVVDALMATAAGLAVPCVAVAVAVPGAVQVPEGFVAAMPHVGWSPMRLGEHLRDRYLLPEVVENDANCLAYGEAQRGVGGPSLVALLVDEGVGAGIIANGQLHRGARAEAGEIGFLLVERSSLGGTNEDRGDLESRVSPAVLTRQLEERGLPLPATGTVTAQYVLELARLELRGAPEIAAQVLDFIALGVAALIVVMDPEVVVVDSGLAGAVPAIHERLYHRIGRVPRIAAATHGIDGVLVGAAELAAAQVNSFAYLDG
jgi:predicted NBD/HSP70 family sugar kinase